MSAKTRKTLLIALGVMVAVVLIYVVWVKIANIGKYRYIIESQVSEATGYVLSIDGEMRMHAFPLGFSIQNIHLQNPEDFAEFGPDFLYIAESRVKLKLSPFLTGSFVPKDIVINDVTLNLARNKYGHANWDFGVVDAVRQEYFGAASENNKAQVGKMLQDLTFDKLKIENGRITYQDVRPGGGGFNMEEVQVEAGPFDMAKDRLNFAFKARTGNNPPLNMNGYIAGGIGQISGADWPYDLEIHIDSRFSLPK